MASSTTQRNDSRFLSLQLYHALGALGFFGIARLERELNAILPSEAK